MSGGEKERFGGWDKILHSPPAGGTTWSSSFILVRFQIFLIIALSSSLACSRLPAGWKSSETGIKQTLQRSNFLSGTAVWGGKYQSFVSSGKFWVKRCSDYCLASSQQEVFFLNMHSHLRVGRWLCYWLIVCNSPKQQNHGATSSQKATISSNTSNFNWDPVEVEYDENRGQLMGNYSLGTPIIGGKVASRNLKTWAFLEHISRITCCSPCLPADTKFFTRCQESALESLHSALTRHYRHVQGFCYSTRRTVPGYWCLFSEEQHRL